MKLSIEWLNEFVDTSDISVSELCDRITMSGSKVEDYEVLSSEISNVISGKILKIEKHPDADKLSVCTVDIGKENPITIVTSATNIFENAIIPVAVAPSTLTGGVKIEAGKLRGILSEGMFCSISELGLTINDMPGAIEDGIFILPDDIEIGVDVCDALGLRDTVINFEITPNRPDCLSIIGLAREVGATIDKKVNYHNPEYTATSNHIDDYISSIEIIDKDLCSRYTAAVVKDVKIAPSPLWIRNRLRAMGVRPINNIVDITNYVMLEYGQPMHAFDYKCLTGSKITIRKASDNEDFITLDDNVRRLNSDMLVIADEIRPVALAGVMGGANSEITDETNTVVFESANFNGPSIRNTSRRLGMRTESSGRFEKGLDPELTIKALNRALELIQLLDAGTIVEGIIDKYENKLEENIIKLNSDKINSFLGTEISKDEMISILNKLDFYIENDNIHVPSFRSDVTMNADVAEEIARFYGYDKIKPTLFTGGAKIGKYTKQESNRNIINDTLLSCGYYEAKTFSFISNENYNKVNINEDDEIRNSIRILNPLGEETSIMRRTILPSLMEVFSANYKLRNPKLKLFETAKIYIPGKNDEHEEKYQTVLGFYGYGDFFDIKGDVEDVLNIFDISDINFESNKNGGTFHPGRCADVFAGNNKIATIGEIHPSVTDKFDIDTKVYIAVIDTDYISNLTLKEKRFSPLPKYPKITRDFSFVCDNSLESAEVIKIIKSIDSDIIEGVELFDFYKGVQLGPDKKSLSYRVALRSDDHTLTDKEADDTVSIILKELDDKLSIKLRG